ncbi:MAG: molybdenum cofactor biosynthesis protein MoaE [Pseudomonadota bacterium]
MGVDARLQLERVDPSAELAKLLDRAAGYGAAVTFVGTARPRTKEGKPVELIVLEHHSRLTLQSLEEIAADGATRFSVDHITVVHRYGDILPGEPIVFVGACSLHRRAAFEAADYVMDRLKTEAVFWKREEGPSGANWIEPTEADYADRDRWE